MHSPQFAVHCACARSVHNNAELSIGGLLCFNPATLGVVQILEGPAFAVQSTYLKIKADTRHSAVELTSEEVLFSKAECHFDASWGMMQSETQESQTGLLDLSSRLARAAAAHSSHASSKLTLARTPRLARGARTACCLVGSLRLSRFIASAIQASVAQIDNLKASKRQELMDSVVQIA